MDRLASTFDETTLSLGNSGKYLSGSRTILWDVGILAPNGQPGSKGEFTFTVKLRSELSAGSVVITRPRYTFPAYLRSPDQSGGEYRSASGRWRSTGVHRNRSSSSFHAEGDSPGRGVLTFNSTRAPKYGTLLAPHRI